MFVCIQGEIGRCVEIERGDGERERKRGHCEKKLH